MDEVIQLPKPGLAERARLIRQYFSAYLHHDPPADFLHLPAPAPAPGSAAASTGTTTKEARGGGGGAAARRTSHDGHGSSGRDTLRPKRAAPSLHPELEGGTEGFPPAPAAGEEAGTREQGDGHRGDGRACDGAVPLSEGFTDRAPGLMAMLAVRSEGFYGRDMAHFFSAVQVREGGKTRRCDCNSYCIRSLSHAAIRGSVLRGDAGRGGGGGAHSCRSR